MGGHLKADFHFANHSAELDCIQDDWADAECSPVEDVEMNTLAA